MKKLLSLIVVAVLVLSILPMGAMAEAAQKAFPEGRTQTIEKPTGGIKAPEENKAPEKPSYREESTLYYWDFSGDPEADGWQFIDRDGDGKNWRANTNYYHSGSPSIMSGSWDGSNTYVDNWAITPAIELPESGVATFKYWVKGHSGSYPEVYGIYVGTEAEPANMSQLGTDYSTVGTDWTE